MTVLTGCLKPPLLPNSSQNPNAIELEGKVVGITAAVPGPGRGRRGLKALADTLSAVRATIVGGTPISPGAEFEAQVVWLVRAVVQAARRRIAIRPVAQSQ